MHVNVCLDVSGAANLKKCEFWRSSTCSRPRLLPLFVTLNKTNNNNDNDIDNNNPDDIIVILHNTIYLYVYHLLHFIHVTDSAKGPRTSLPVYSCSSPDAPRDYIPEHVTSGSGSGFAWFCLRSLLHSQNDA